MFMFIRGKSAVPTVNIYVEDRKTFDDLIQKAAVKLAQEGYPVSQHNGYEYTISSVLLASLRKTVNEKAGER